MIRVVLYGITCFFWIDERYMRTMSVLSDMTGKVSGIGGMNVWLRQVLENMIGEKGARPYDATL